MKKPTNHKWEGYNFIDFSIVRLYITGLTHRQMDRVIVEQLPVENNKDTYKLIIPR
jgi:hypothetical protein